MSSQHQSTSASFQMQNEGIQASAFGQNSSLNADPLLGQHSSRIMAAHPTSSPAMTSSLGEAQPGKAVLGFGNAEASRFRSQPFGGSSNFNNSYLNGLSQWMRGLGNQVSNWIQRSPTARDTSVNSAAMGAHSPGFVLPKLPTNLSPFSVPVNTPSTQPLVTVELPSEQPLIGVIDTGFGAEQHGAHVLSAITGTGGEPQEADGFSNKSSVWLGQGVGENGWASSLKEFVNVAKATPHRPAIANLSFSLTQKNPDGTVSSRQSLTTDEHKALQYAENNGVLVVAAAGNRGESQSAWGQASKDFDNLVVVGSAEGIYRARHSNFGSGLDILAPGQEAGRMLKGTSLAAARVTGTIADMWTANGDLSAQQVKHLLKSTATDLHTPGWDAQTGAGLLNIPGAVVAAKSIPDFPSGGSSFQMPTQIYPGEAKFQAEPPRAALPSGRKPNSPNLAPSGGAKPRDPEAAINRDGLDLIKNFEGFRTKAYQDSGGVWTIGFGHTGSDVKPGQSVSAERATELLKQDVKEAEGAVRRMVDVPLNSNQFSALTSLVYNLGAGNFSRSPVLKHLNAGNYKEAAAAFDTHNRGGGQVLNGLIRRRGAEQALFQKPDEAAKKPQESRQAAPISDKPKNNDDKPKPGISAADKATEKVLETARKYVGVRERGHNRGPEVEKFQRAVDGKAQGEPWCMSFAQYAIKSAESATKVDSKVFSSEHCMTVWNRSPKELRLSKPKPGSLVIWRHGNSSSGHVGIVEKVHADGSFTTIEGNTGGGKGVNRDGDGVYRRKRTLNGAGSMKVVGFLKPF